MAEVVLVKTDRDFRPLRDRGERAAKGLDPVAGLVVPRRARVVEHPRRPRPVVRREPARREVRSHRRDEARSHRHPAPFPAFRPVLPAPTRDPKEPALEVDVLPPEPERFGLAAEPRFA